jgi:hypothetical protein
VLPFHIAQDDVKVMRISVATNTLHVVDEFRYFVLNAHGSLPVVSLQHEG